MGVFWKNRASSVFSVYGPLTSYQNSEETSSQADRTHLNEQIDNSELLKSINKFAVIAFAITVTECDYVS